MPGTTAETVQVVSRMLFVFAILVRQIGRDLGTAKPLTDQMYDRTYHDGTFNPQPGSNNYPNQVLSLTIPINGELHRYFWSGLY